MITIVIDESAVDADAMADLLEHVADQIRSGNTSGYYPHWHLVGEDELTPRTQAGEGRS